MNGAEAFLDCGVGRNPLGLVRNIEGKGHGICADAVRHSLRGCKIDVGDHDLGALGGQRLAVRCTQSRSAAGD